MRDLALLIGRSSSIPRPPHSILPLVASDLVFEAQGRRLIDAIHLNLTVGAITVVLGPNGAGKSLLLRLLHGLIRPTSGSIHWRGKVADDEIRRRQAMVFQRPVVLRRSTVANVRYALKARRTYPYAGLTERARFWLEAAGLLGLADTPARRLSGGEQQRLAMARALCQEPEVLFLDEPTASLDPASTLTIERLIQVAHESGTKIVLVTHDLGQAKRLAGEVIFLYRGRIEELGTAPSFFEDAMSARATDFLAGRIVL